MTDSMYIVALSTDYGPCGYFFNSPEDKECIERNLMYCIEKEMPWTLSKPNGETIARYNGITAFSVIECTPRNRVR